MTLNTNQILTYFNNNPTKKWTVRDLAHSLQVKGSEQKILKKILKDLVFSGDIQKIAKNLYQKRTEGAERIRFRNTKNRPRVEGRLQLRYEGYGFVLQPEATDIFVASKNMQGALPDDLVVVEVFENKANHKQEGIVVAILTRGRHEWLGTLQKIGNEYYAINREFRVEFTIHIKNYKHLSAKEGDVVLCRITHFPDHSYSSLEGDITQVLGPEGSEATEVRIILAKYGIPENFPKSVILEAAQLKPYTFDDQEDRIDLRHKPFITIDGVDARDFDDAVLVEYSNDCFHLYVSIADVSYYVKQESQIDQEALKRGTSTYFPRFCVPMLPEELSNELCSLKEGVDRPTLTCEMIYDATGRLKSAHYYASVIRSIKRATYEELFCFIKGEEVPGYKKVMPDLYPFMALYDLLEKQKKERGALDFDLPEAYFQYDAKGNMLAVKRRERLMTHKLIEEFMIAANQAVAFLFEQKGVPSLYRVHDNPDPVKMADLKKLMFNLGISASFGDEPTPGQLSKVLDAIKKHPSAEVVNQNLLRSLRVACYSPESRGHFGLALKHYCHFTSPIRRYPDLVVHRTLRVLLKTNPVLKLVINNYKGTLKSATATQGAYSLPALTKFGEQNSAAERNSMEAEREMQSLLICLFLKKFEGSEFIGTIKRIAKFGVFVDLPPHHVEGLVALVDLGLDYVRFDERHMKLVGRVRGREIVFKLGDEINVFLAGVDISRRQIQLERIERKTKRPGFPKKKSRPRRSL